MAKRLAEEWEEHAVEEQKKKRRTGPEVRMLDRVYASGFKDCTREMALDLIHPDERNEFSPYILEILRQGQVLEEDTVDYLREISRTRSWKIVRTQLRLEIKDRDGTAIISGYIDGEIEDYTEDGEKQQILVEIKSGNAAQRITRIEDLGNLWYTKKWLMQLLIYMLANNIQHGLFIMRKIGPPTFIDVNLEDHLDEAERFLTQAGIAVKARKKFHWDVWPPPSNIDTSEIADAYRALPEMTTDKVLCRRCSHMGKSCTPDMSWGDGAILEADTEFAERAERMLEIADVAKEHARLVKINKARVNDILGESQPDEKKIVFPNVVVTAKLIHRKGNPNPKPTSDTSFYKLKYEALEDGNENSSG